MLTSFYDASNAVLEVAYSAVDKALMSAVKGVLQAVWAAVNDKDATQILVFTSASAFALFLIK